MLDHFGDRGGPVRPIAQCIEFEGGSAQSRILAAAIRSAIKPMLSLWAVAPELRWPYRIVDHVGRLLPVAAGTTHRSIALPNCAAEIARPGSVRGDRYIVYMPGGAFMVGGRYLHRNLIAELASALSTEILEVDYRTLPKHTIGDGVSDCVDAYRYALSQGIAPEKVAFVGDSAGAYMVLMAAVVAREQGLPMPGAIVSMAPGVALDWEAKIAALGDATDALFSRRFARSFQRFISRHCPDPETRREPIDADLSGFPPTLIQISSAELLYADAKMFANSLAEAGVPHQLQVWHGQVHVFQAAWSIVPEAARAVGEVIRFIDSTLAVTVRETSA
ncbi:alpha/beta hydrolase [Nocardia sp. NPDC055321]